MNYNDFLKKYKIPNSFLENEEETVGSVQELITSLLINNSYLIDTKLEEMIDNEEGLYPSKEISGLKIIFDMWLKVTGLESTIDVNKALDTLLKEGYDVKIDSDKMNKIYEVIQE